MKKFCFMLAFIAGVITFNCIHTEQAITSDMSQSAIHAVRSKNDDSFMQSLILSAITSGVIYFGMYGLLEYNQKRR